MITQKQANIILITIAIVIFVVAGCSDFSKTALADTVQKRITISHLGEDNSYIYQGFRDENTGCRYIVVREKTHGYITVTPELNPQGQPQCGKND